MLLVELVELYRPISQPGIAWAEQEDWWLHGYRLWTAEPAWMDLLMAWMRREGWLFGPVVVEDGYVQDAHHRIVVALALGWWRRDIPVTAPPAAVGPCRGYGWPGASGAPPARAGAAPRHGSR